ncbi:MAG: histone family protein [Candidatus Heimdallarchaeaceae archaeon]
MGENVIPINTMHKIMKKAGARRVSDKAAKELSYYLEREIEKITRRAIQFSRHAGRVTVTREDIKLAVSEVE